MKGIDFVRSSRAVTEDVSEDGTSHSVSMTTVFEVEPGTLPDLRAGFGQGDWLRPDTLIVKWKDGGLYEIKATGFRALKNGGVGVKRPKYCMVFDFGKWTCVDAAREVVQAAIDEYLDGLDDTAHPRSTAIVSQ